MPERADHAANRPDRTPTSGAAPRLALIGCGAIAERYHLPALARHPTVLAQLVLVDADEARANEVAERFGAGAVSVDHRRVLDDVDGAIVTVPQHLHHPIGMAFLERGVHVLCEKPLAVSVAQAREMVAQARQNDVALCVNHTRRLFPSYGAVRRLLQGGELGALRSIRYEDGGKFHWASASGFYFRKGSATGVLIDKGIHGLDAVCWWLGGTPRVLASRNDSFGGVESVARLDLAFEDCRIELLVNRLARLENRYRIVGESGVAEGGIEDWGKVTITHASGRRELRTLTAPQQSYDEFGSVLIDNFLAVVAGRAAPLVPGHDVLPALEVIESAYRNATRFEMPWYEVWEERHGTR